MAHQHQHHDSLRTQFSALQASVPLADIPSLPPPRLTSPVKQQQQQQLHQMQMQQQQQQQQQQMRHPLVHIPNERREEQQMQMSSSGSSSDVSSVAPSPTGQIFTTANNSNYSTSSNTGTSSGGTATSMQTSSMKNVRTATARQQQISPQHQHQHQYQQQHPYLPRSNSNDQNRYAQQQQQQQQPPELGYQNQGQPYQQQLQPQHEPQPQPQQLQPQTQMRPQYQNRSFPASHQQQHQQQQLRNRPPPPPINTQLNGSIYQQKTPIHDRYEQYHYDEAPLSMNVPPKVRSPVPPIPVVPPLPQSLPENGEYPPRGTAPSTPISQSNPSPLVYRNQEQLLPGKAFGIKQRSGSEMVNRNFNYNDAKRSPSLPQSRDGFYNQEQLQSSPPGSSSTTSSGQKMVNSARKSPIVRQSLNFLKSARNFSTSSLNQQGLQQLQQPDSPVSSYGHSSSKEMEKYHMPSKQMTASGRIIPQKVDYSGTSSGTVDTPKKSRSLSTLTKRVASNSSLRSSADKSRYLSTSTLGTTNTLQTSPSMKKRYIYPAIISEVADAFLHEIKLGCHFKYGIEYRNSFSGSEAIDVICRITKIRDRNLAIILGRSLDSQGLFHDVTYEHRLRDNKAEVYLISDEFLYNNQNESFRRQNSVNSMANHQDDYNMAVSSSSATLTQSGYSYGLATTPSANGFVDNRMIVVNQSATRVNHNSLPISGVFALLTECYSPTCTRDKVCYSVSCPRRFEQKMRAEMNASSLVRSDSHISFDQDEQKQYWQLTVPKSILESLDKKEVKRQECIFETINSEKTFIKDLEYIREFWIRPLRETKIIKEKERDQFIRNVFHNITEIWEVNHRFAEALVRRQQKSPIVDSIADIFLDFIPQFTPFITYGAGQVIGKYEFDRQRRHNPLLKRFIEDTAKREESKRLDLSSFLSKPTTRPARYPLLLKSIRDHTDPESAEYKKLGTAIELLAKMLTKINYETGKQSDKMNLFQIKQKLLFKPGELVDLKLSADNRKVIYQCVLKKKGYQEKEKQGEIHVYLFDHCILFIKLGYLNKREVYKVYQRPIPLPLLFYATTEFPPTMRAIRKAAMKTGSAPSLMGQSSNSSLIPLNSTVSKSPISFKYLGIHGYELTLYGTPATQKILSNKIEAQTKKILADNDVYTLTPLCSNVFDAQNRINCLVPFDGGRKLLYGTDSGVYVSDRSAANTTRTKVISKLNIIQVEIIQEYQILVALCDKKLLYWPTSVLNGGDPMKNAKLAKELMNHVSLFKIGVCDGRMLLCAAKSTSNIVRIFEPIDPIQQKKQKKKFINDRADIHFVSEPVSINFLKTKLCVGCSSGFQIVSLVNNSMEELLDPADTSLEFATSKEGLKPLGIDRINSDFLLSYSNFSFFINHNGWRVRPKWMIEWEGVPHSFALWYPYLLAFDTNFIEIRSVQNAELLRVIVGENIRFLHASSQEILYAYEDDKGYDVVASLDFWDKSMKNNRSRGNTVNAHSKQISVDL